MSFGTRVSKGRGKRTDMDSIKEFIEDDRSISDIMNEHFGSYIRYHRGIEKAINLKKQRVINEKTIEIHWGDTGTGKTHGAYERYDINDIWEYPGEGWFDGFNGQRLALFDEFDGGEFKTKQLLKLWDKYPMQVRIKGGFTNWNPDIIYITSNIDPDLWYKNLNHRVYQAFKRRITSIWRHDEDGTVTMTHGVMQTCAEEPRIANCPWYVQEDC